MVGFTYVLPASYPPDKNSTALAKMYKNSYQILEMYRMKILGIESSCDETAAAVVEDGRTLLSSVIASSVEEQALYGGVVPEIASRRHIESISHVAQRALQQAGLTAAQLDGIAVTYAPGLIGALLVGVNFAKGLAYAAQKPLVPVHHLRGHVASLYLTHPTLKPPFLCLITSGGHCHLVHVQSYTQFDVLGRTVDDAAGEAFDKVARTLGLGYPGGPAVSNAAEGGDISAYTLPTPHAEGEYNVSFSGLKTAVLNIVNQSKMQESPLDVAGLSASFEYKIADILSHNLAAAAANTGLQQVALAGGVSANNRLRQLTKQRVEAVGATLYLPQLALCGDNAAMIAAQGYYEQRAGHIANLRLNAFPSMPMEENNF